MIITPKQPRDDRTVSRLGKLVPYMLRGKGEERCTWCIAGNLEGLDRRKDAELAREVMEVLQKGNVRAKGNKTYHLVISLHPEDRCLERGELQQIQQDPPRDLADSLARRILEDLCEHPPLWGFCIPNAGGKNAKLL